MILEVKGERAKELEKQIRWSGTKIVPCLLMRIAGQDFLMQITNYNVSYVSNEYVLRIDYELE